MAFLSIPSVSIKGISAAVPSRIERVSDYSLFTEEESKKFSSSTGVYERRICENGMISSDLCFFSAEKLILDLEWKKDDIDILVFVSQTRDYILPSTSCILQDRLGLPKTCMTIDIPYGCSGYIYGLSVISSLMSSGTIKKGLLLCGDSIHYHHNYFDKSSYPLFGDAGTATALEYNPIAKNMNFNFGTDGGGYKAIIIEDGGYRNRVNNSSFDLVDYESEGKRTKLDCYLNGMDVFSFGISKAPSTIKSLCENYTIDFNSIDYFIIHQANMMMNEMIRKKLKIDETKVPYSLSNFGNTSCSTIPLTMVTELKNLLPYNKLKLIGCGFGVGLSWGSVYFETENIVCSKLIEL